MISIEQIDPFRCRMWALHARLDESVDEESCRAEIESWESQGQIVPALGRRVRDTTDYDIELIYGARRLFVARHLNVPLKVELKNISDRDALVAMDVENRLRTSLSPYERGRCYARWLEEGHFRSQDELAAMLHVSSSQISRLLRLARLPGEIVDAFGAPAQICESWSVVLANGLKTGRRQMGMISEARRLASLSPRPAPRDVFKMLCTAGRTGSRHAAERAVKDDDGTELFRIKHSHGSVVLTLPLDKISSRTLQSIELVIARIMELSAPDVIHPLQPWAPPTQPQVLY